MQIGTPLTEAVHKALAASGLQPKPTQPNKVSKDASTGKKQQQPKLASSQAEAAAEISSADQPQAQEARQSATQGKAKAASKAIKHSGDDLGQDFDVDIDPSEEGASKKKTNKSSLDKESLVTMAKPSKLKHKSKTHKVVQF